MGVKYEKTDLDTKIEANDLATNRTLKHLQNLNFYKFNIGDVLVREDKWGGEWKLRTASNGLPYKYVYVFENSLGIGYIRRMSITGEKFVESPVCVVNFDPQETRFELDPSYADHLLMAEDSEEFSFKDSYKELRKKRDAMNRANDKLAEKINNERDVVSLFRKLKVGDQIWYGWSPSAVNEQPYIVKTIYFDNYREADSYIELWPSWVAQSTAHYNSYYFRKETGETMVGKRVYLTRPQFTKDLLT